MSAPAGTVYYTTNGWTRGCPSQGRWLRGARFCSRKSAGAAKGRGSKRGRWRGRMERAERGGVCGGGDRSAAAHHGDHVSSGGWGGYEYVELENVSSVPVDLSGMSFEGWSFGLRKESVVGEWGGWCWLRQVRWRLRSGILGWWCGGGMGSAGQRGERLALKDRNGRTVVSVDYRDGGGWAEGRWWRAVVGDDRCAGDPDDPANWQASGGGRIAGGRLQRGGGGAGVAERSDGGECVSGRPGDQLFGLGGIIQSWRQRGEFGGMEFE